MASQSRLSMAGQIAFLMSRAVPHLWIKLQAARCPAVCKDLSHFQAVFEQIGEAANLGTRGLITLAQPRVSDFSMLCQA